MRFLHFFSFCFEFLHFFRILALFCEFLHIFFSIFYLFIFYRNRYEAHNASVIANCFPERLLVLNVKEGWKPLCTFMGIPQIAGLLPHKNKGTNKSDVADFIDDTMEPFMKVCKREVWTIFFCFFCKKGQIFRGKKLTPGLLHFASFAIF